MAEVYLALLAGGSSARFGKNKLALELDGVSVLERAYLAFHKCSYRIAKTVIAAGGANHAAACALAEKYGDISVVCGGETRFMSVKNALDALDGSQGVVAVHDAARPLVSADVIDCAIASALEYGAGVAALPVRDTLRREDGETVAREGLFAMQTPQAFDLAKLQAAYAHAADSGESFTDDLGVWISAGNEPRYAKGSAMNIKLTYDEDADFARIAISGGARLRTGYGEDTHALTVGRRLILGGVDIPYERGLLGHSDADALIHAVIDALMGAAALGDIGRAFPDTDARYKDISSLVLLERTRDMLASLGFTVENIDATVIAQAPKLAPYIEDMRENIAAALGVNAERVSVKATTTEHMNDEGRGLCITARAVCMLSK